jgi:Zn-dependent protease
MSRIDIYGFLGLGIGLLIGMIGHELAHARVAVSLGDPTPRMMGRLTLNPKAHADPFGTVIMPGIFLISVLFRSEFGFLFGYAKPVTIHPGRLRNPRRDAVLVALAGPAFNLLVVALVGIAFRQGSVDAVNADMAGREGLYWILYWVAVVNTFLFIINILPIPPLDGSKVLARFLSPAAAMKMEEWGQYLILFLVVLFLIFRGVLGNFAAAIYEPILDLERVFI